MIAKVYNIYSLRLYVGRLENTSAIVSVRVVFKHQPTSGTMLWTISTLDATYLISTVSGLIIGCCSFILQLSLALSLLYKHPFCRNKNKLSKLPFDEQALPISGFTIYVGGFLISLNIVITWIYRISFDEYTPIAIQRPSDIDRQLIKLRIGFMLFYGFTLISLYLFLVCRLYSTFKDTVFEIKAFTIKIYIGILMSSVGLSAIVLILGGFDFDRFIMFLLTAAASFLQLCAIIHLLYSFIRGLFLIVLQQRHSFINEKIELSETQKKMMATARKHTLIGVIAIVLGLMAAVTYVVAIVIDREAYVPASSYPNWKAYDAVFDGIIVCTLNLMNFTLFLGFTVNQAMYTMLCSSCDKKCDALCEKLVLSTFYDQKHTQSDDIDIFL